MNYFNSDAKFELDRNLMLKKLEAKENSKIAKKLDKLIPIIEETCKPKYIFREVKIEEITEDGFKVDGIEFKSKICADKLKDISTMYVYIVTCGSELANLQGDNYSTIENFILDKACNLACYFSRDNLKAEIRDKFNTQTLTSLNPGSIIDWSVKDVVNLFKLFGQEYENIGVRVIESGMIDPLSSVSGFFINTDKEFHACELCMKKDCPNRKAPFDEEKYLNAMKL